MGLKIEDLLFEKIELPKRYYNGDFNILDKFKQETTEYLKLLKQIDGAEFTEDKQKGILLKIKEILPEIEENIESIENIFTFYENANPKAAQEELDSMMFRLDDALLISTIDDRVRINVEGKALYTKGIRITSGAQFFRVRAVDEKMPYIENNPDELFHIPLTKKAYTNNERFSLAGFPSLYLSSMLQLAWQECGYPQKYYYSEFQYEIMTSSLHRDVTNELKFLSLYSPYEIYQCGISMKHNNFKVWLGLIANYLKQYPLVLACSFVNHSGKVTYKQEYIIPQMLMQWVQRNKSVVQGISYFTCVDISMFPNKWCAYNIVIPAQPPFDEKMYSSKLRDDFCWSRPKYYSVFISDKNINNEDRKVMFNYIEKIRNTLRTYRFVEPLREHLQDIECVCVCIYHIMQSGESSDMQLILHQLHLIDRFCCKLKKQKPEELVKSAQMEGIPEYEREDIELAKQSFLDVANEFVESGKNSMYEIFNKYRDTIWNDLGSKTVIELIYKKDDDIEKEISWLHKNNFIHCCYFLAKNDDSVSHIKDICKESGIPLEMLWDMSIGDDAWIKEHICDIKTPIFVRKNSISRYSDENERRCDYFHMGFDEKELEAGLC